MLITDSAFLASLAPGLLATSGTMAWSGQVFLSLDARAEQSRYRVVDRRSIDYDYRVPREEFCAGSNPDSRGGKGVQRSSK
jgi:hypothetical protein